jgi:hypothetical protein
MSLRYTRENIEPHFSHNEGFSISSIRVHGEERGQVPPKPLPFETLYEGSTIRFLGSVYATAQVATVRRLLPRVLRLLPFIISYDMTKEVGQGSGSSEHMGGYDWFISLLFYVFQIMLVSVVYPYCFKRCYESVSFVQLYRFCLYSVSVSAIRYMSCLLVSLVQSSCFIYCCLYVSIVLSYRFTCCHMFIVVIRYSLRSFISIILAFGVVTRSRAKPLSLHLSRAERIRGVTY